MVNINELFCPLFSYLSLSVISPLHDNKIVNNQAFPFLYSPNCSILRDVKRCYYLSDQHTFSRI